MTSGHNGVTAKVAAIALGAGLLLSLGLMALCEITSGTVPASLATVAGACAGGLGTYLSTRDQ